MWRASLSLTSLFRRLRPYWNPKSRSSPAFPVREMVLAGATLYAVLWKTPRPSPRPYFRVTNKSLFRLYLKPRSFFLFSTLAHTCFFCRRVPRWTFLRNWVKNKKISVSANPLRMTRKNYLGRFSKRLLVYVLSIRRIRALFAIYLYNRIR